MINDPGATPIRCFFFAFAPCIALPFFVFFCCVLLSCAFLCFDELFWGEHNQYCATIVAETRTSTAEPVLRNQCCGTSTAEPVLRKQYCGTSTAQPVVRHQSCGTSTAAPERSSCGTRAPRAPGAAEPCGTWRSQIQAKSLGILKETCGTQGTRAPELRNPAEPCGTSILPFHYIFLPNSPRNPRARAPGLRNQGSGELSTPGHQILCTE